MKLSEIQQKLKAPKNQFNKFGGYKYRNCEDILEALKSLLGDSVVTISDEIVQIGDRFYVKATAQFYEPNQSNGTPHASVTAFARESLDKKGMDAAQITGAASSYARKYALNGLFLIDDTRDADSEENAPEGNFKPYSVPRKVPAADDEAGGNTEEQEHRQAEIEATQKEQIKDLMRNLNLPLTKNSIIKATGHSMNPENYQQIIEKLRAKLEATDPLADLGN